PVVEMRELVLLLGAELGNARPKSQPQVLRAHVAQEIRVQRHVVRLRRPDQDALATPRGFMQFAYVFVRHRSTGLCGAVQLRSCEGAPLRKSSEGARRQTS